MPRIRGRWGQRLRMMGSQPSRRFNTRGQAIGIGNNQIMAWGEPGEKYWWCDKSQGPGGIPT